MTHSSRFWDRIAARYARKPVADEARFQKIWEEHVYALKGAYEMND